MKISGQFLIFVSGGVLCAVIDIGLMQLLIMFGTTPLVAATAGFVSGLLVNYLFHAKLTFSSSTSVTGLTKFLSVAGVNYLVTIGFVALSVALIDNALAGKIISLPFIAIYGFLLSKYWIFK